MKNKIRKIINLIKQFILGNNISIVKLETLLKAKNNLEQSIKTDYEFIGKALSKKKPQLDVFTTAFSAIKTKHEQLVLFKLAQQKANLKTHLNGKSNFAYIYELSNLNNEKEYLDNVKKMIAKLKLAKNEFDEPNKILNEVVRKIQIISEKLSTFNSTQMVKVQLVPGLNLL